MMSLVVLCFLSLDRAKRNGGLEMRQESTHGHDGMQEAAGYLGDGKEMEAAFLPETGFRLFAGTINPPSNPQLERFQ
jgi:hypothetical protein